MRSLFAHPIISTPGKFLARVVYGALWGVLLSDAEADVRLGFGLMLGLLALVMSFAFLGWDRKSRLDASRVTLYGLFVAGEVLCVGAVVLMALSAFQMIPDWAYAAAVAAFSGYLVSVYSLVALVKRNIAERRGSTQ